MWSGLDGGVLSVTRDLVVFLAHIYKVVDGDVNESDDKSNNDVDHINQSNGDNAGNDDSVCEHQLAPISPSLLYERIKDYCWWRGPTNKKMEITQQAEVKIFLFKAKDGSKF